MAGYLVDGCDFEKAMTKIRLVTDNHERIVDLSKDGLSCSSGASSQRNWL